MYKQKGKLSGFHQFHEEWHEQLRELVQQLKKAPRPATNQEQHELHTHLVQKFTSHYYEYYRVKSMAAKNDILHIFSAPWSNSLERSLYWIAGWRPTTAFHIIYTKSSILFESPIVDILRGFGNGDLGDLSPNQLSRLSEFQYETVQQENAITEQLSDWQASSWNFFFFLFPFFLFLFGFLFSYFASIH
nr:PREDICTED: transcription factor TGA2-like [Nicotiana tabacum]